MIDLFLSITTKPLFAILLRFIYFCFNIIGAYIVVLFCKDSVSLLRFPFLSNVQVFSCEISFVYYFTHLGVFHTTRVWVTASHIKSTGLSILVDLSNAAVWMVSTCPLISKSSSPCTNHFVTVLNALITIGITVTFTFDEFFFNLWEGLGIHLSFHLYPVISRNGKVCN